MTPLGALVRGFVAGALGSLGQDLFFAATKKVAPSSGSTPFEPPEPEQQDEQATETVARRTFEGLMQRELPIDQAEAGRAVHYAFGAGWGGLYGLSAASAPKLATPGGGAAFGLLVWGVSDDLLLPAFKLAAWPKHYPAKVHAYAIAAHLVYGAVTWLAFSALRPREERAERERLAERGSSRDSVPEVPVTAAPS